MAQRRIFGCCGVLMAIAAMPLAHCLDDAGWNDNERSPGNGEDGVPLWGGEIAIDPTGRYLLTSHEGKLIYGDLNDGATHALPKLTGATRVVFDHAGKSVFASRIAIDPDENLELRGGILLAYPNGEGARLVRYDLEKNKEAWSRPVDVQVTRDRDYQREDYPFLAVTGDDQHIVVAESHRVDVIAADSGKSITSTGILPQRVADIDITPDQKRLVITLAHQWVDPEHALTRILIGDLTHFEAHEVEVPNCTSELAIAPDGKRAFLAPPECIPDEDEFDDDDAADERLRRRRKNHDPVSVIDLENEMFVRNLPGFGPVALAQGGTLAVAFMDREALDERLFDDPEQIPRDGARYRLMLIDTQTLAFETLELGDEIPRYALAPDGQLLLVDSPSYWRDGRIRVLDTASRTLKQLIGPGLTLDNYVMTRDSKQAFVLSGGLYRISLAQRRAIAEPLEFSPINLNITPDDQRLVLREDEETLWVYDVQTSQLQFSLDVGL